ncbi:MAG: hypothetical protein KC589_04470 [Nanoarchaeota archaeon]|nr:hypothetical protein [Nanoarchaeota archaeon]
MVVLEHDIKEILCIGVKAISPYNSQPWRFRIKNNIVEIYVIRTKNFFLKLQGVSFMTLGFLLENLSEGARHLNYNFKIIKITGDLNLDKPCAIIELNKLNYNRKYNIDFLHLRCTNRKNYDDRAFSLEIKKDIILNFQKEASKDFSLYFFEKNKKNKFARILGELETVRMDNDKMLRESFEYIRFDKEENLEKKDLLDVETLEYSSKMIGVMKKIKKNPFYFKFLNFFGYLSILRKKNIFHLKSSGAILTYSIKERTDKNYVKLGMLVQKQMNYFSKLGIESQAILSGFYLLDVLHENPEIFTKKQKNIILNAKFEIEDLFNILDLNIAFLVRIGYGEKPKVVSLRKNIEEFILK